ncbi:MAG: hypothetical protein ACLRPW_02155 [Intestinibacter sp.]
MKNKHYKCNTVFYIRRIQGKITHNHVSSKSIKDAKAKTEL